MSKELPEELTHELLSLVLDEEVQFGLLGGKIRNNHLSFQLKDTKEINVYKQINLDTLTRLCKAYCTKDNEIMNSFNSSSVQGYVVRFSRFEKKQFIAKNEFEAVLKATDWIINHPLS